MHVGNDLFLVSVARKYLVGLLEKQTQRNSEPTFKGSTCQMTQGNSPRSLETGLCRNPQEYREGLQTQRHLI